MTRPSRRWIYAVEWLIVMLGVFVLVWPLMKSKYLDLWPSIESTFIADARFLKDHWVHPNWQPNWYCGTRTDYVYPPALRYGTAVLARYVPRLLPVKAYHIYTGFFYCFGIAAVYLLARWGSRSRAAALFAAAGTALLSPTYLFVQSIRDDTPLWMPYRLNVLVRYGEGPHMTALAWIPLALLFSFRTLQGWRPASFAAAAFCSAMVVSNNFYGATALAMMYPLLAWSVYITHLDKRMWLQAAAIPVLAYGLTAFWLVPSYLRITIHNMKFVSSEGNMWSGWVGLGMAAGFLLLSDHLARGRRDRAWFTFLSGAVVVFFVNAVGNHYLNFRIFGEPGRLFPEMDMLMLLWVAEVFRRIWIAPWRCPVVARVTVVLLAFAIFVPSWRYLTQYRTVFVTDPAAHERVEYELQDWMAKNKPHYRSVPAGSVRFWYNVWNDLPQLGGGSEQGLLNPKVIPPIWQIYLDSDADMSIRWMQVLGVDAVIVNGNKSREWYHDHQFPDKFRGKLNVLYDNGKDDVIYEVPRRYRSLARVVDRARQNSLPVIPGNGRMPELQAWFDVVENGPDAPAETRWEGTDVLHVKTTVREGQSVWIPESFDHNWHAYIGSQRIPVRGDKLGFMVVDAPPGDHDIRLEFPTPLVNWFGRAVTVLSVFVLFGFIWLGQRQR